MTVRCAAVAIAMMLAGSANAARGQTVAAHLASGDSAQAVLNPSVALAGFEAALGLQPENYEALWKASRELADMAEYERDKAKRAEWYRRAEHYGRRAVAARPEDAEGHFHLARALGRVALTLGPRDRVKYGTAVREHALRALEIDPNHPGALHVLGRWNAEVRRLSGVTRFLAKNVLGGKVFGSASWDEAVRHMSRAVEVDPHRLVHHLDLAEIYLDIGDNAKAREHFEQVVTGAVTDYNDPHFKAEATAALAKLK